MEAASAVLITAVAAIAIAIAVSSFYAIQYSLSVFIVPSSIACVYSADRFPDGTLRISVSVANTGGAAATVSAVAVLTTPSGYYFFESNRTVIPGGSTSIMYIYVPPPYSTYGSIYLVVASSIEGVSARCRG
ncbi:MAG: hypothetical protein QXE01_05030 [Sulfolobales archaeon]